MKKVKIITDSQSGFSQEEANKLGITNVAMPFLINGKDYLEGVNISTPEFFELLKDENAEISTSQPSLGYMMEIWDELLKDNDENLEEEDNDTIIAEDGCKKNQHLNCDKNNDDCCENNNCTECLMERFSLSELGDLSALSGVKKFPMRVKCATLAWHTFENAVSDLIIKSDDCKK